MKVEFKDLTGKPLTQEDQYTTLETNAVVEDETWIFLPLSGTLSVYYAYAYGGQPAERVYIWHQGGNEENVPPGLNTFTVNQGDALAYRLGSERYIKLAWAYN